jgi:flagellar hook-associated protein 3 FlgL
MRISTNTIYSVNVSALNQQEAKLVQTQQQLSSGRRILTPADDPFGAAQALIVTQSDATNTQYGSNLKAAQLSLQLSDTTLQTTTDLLQNIRTTAVQAGSTTLANSDRLALATNLQNNLDQLISLANTTDASGNYLFSGFQGKTQPFVNTATGVQYMGDGGQRMVQVSSSRQIPSSDSGADVFMRIKNGNGTFVTQAAGTNTGSGTASPGSVTDPTQLTGDNYQIDFTVTGGVTTYNITDTTTSTLVSSNNPYVSGQAISFGGMQFVIQGAPASGDQFTVTPSSNESVFKTISDLINTLKTPVISSNLASTAQFSSGVSKALNGLDNSLTNILNMRASVGSRLSELDALSTTQADMGLQFKQALSQLQDVDYNKAISDLTQQQTTLQAAQKSFLQVMNLSIFNYM